MYDNIDTAYFYSIKKEKREKPECIRTKLKLRIN